MRTSSSETRLRGAGDGTWHSWSCHPGFWFLVSYGPLAWTRQFDFSSGRGSQKDASLRRQGAAGAPPDDASALARSWPPWSPRWRRAPDASRPPRHTTPNADERDGPCYSAGADAGATTECLQLQHPQRRRRSATRSVAAHPNCACGAHVVCVLWWCSRPGRAPRRTGIAAEAI